MVECETDPRQPPPTLYLDQQGEGMKKCCMLLAALWLAGVGREPLAGAQAYNPAVAEEEGPGEARPEAAKVSRESAGVAEEALGQAQPRAAGVRGPAAAPPSRTVFPESYPERLFDF